MDDGRPLFEQIADALEGAVLDGSMPEGTQVPSINELAVFHRINPATALKGVNRLVDAGIVHKRRGIGMFVTEGARARLLEERRGDFVARHLAPVVARAKALGIQPDELADLIRKEMAR
ncbi:GntR family transcriptional regulator [Demequina capsici]|uniref:GntR family transcriptional regulator n=1 Tax=Demequina capsici TaxID=3075620 RepID=UPI0035E40576